MRICFKLAGFVTIITAGSQMVAPAFTSATMLLHNSCYGHCSDPTAKDSIVTFTANSHWNKKRRTESIKDFTPSLTIGGPKISQGSGTR